MSRKLEIIKRGATVPVNIRILEVLVERVKRAARTQGVSQTAIIVLALEKELSVWEDELIRKRRIWEELGDHESLSNCRG